jgi:hypothetical protein
MAKGTPTSLREVRTVCGGRLTYRHDGPADSGPARWCDVSRTGARIALGRYLRPGRWVTLEFDAPLVCGAPVQVRARVVWCRPSGDGLSFEAGLSVLRETPELALDFAALGYRARAGANSPGAGAVSSAGHPVAKSVSNTGPQAGAVLPQAS